VTQFLGRLDDFGDRFACKILVGDDDVARVATTISIPSDDWVSGPIVHPSFRPRLLGARRRARYHRFLQPQVRFDADDGACAFHAFDGDGCPTPVASISPTVRPAAWLDPVQTSNEVGQGRGFSGAVDLGSGQHFSLSLDCFVADAAAHEPRQDVDAHDNGAERAENVGDGIADGDIRL
jgi:hypothetical protein